MAGFGYRDPFEPPLELESLRLEPGVHSSPRDGVCVVEMASMVAGEEFSDNPSCVCEVIAAFLRTWNDRATYTDRQRLRPYAARIVGTRAGERTTRLRRDACLASVGVRLGGGPKSRLLSLAGSRVRIAWTLGIGPALRLNEGAGEYAARICFARGGSEAAFELLERLLEIEPRAGETTSPTVEEGKRFARVLLRARAEGAGVGADRSRRNGAPNGASANGATANGNRASPRANGAVHGNGRRSRARRHART